MSYAVLGDSSGRGEPNLRSIPSASDDDVLTRGSSSRDVERQSSLSEPMLNASSGHSTGEDPFYVFREDLYRKLEQVDEGLADYLRIIHQTVRLGYIFSVRQRTLSVFLLST